MIGENIERREFISGTLALSLGMWLTPHLSWANMFSSDGDVILQAPLPYSFDALEPFIDAKTMDIHYSKHHAGYVKNLNEALNVLKKQPLTKITENTITQIAELPDSVKTKIRNNGGGHLNHTFFWNILSPQKDQLPSGALDEAIRKTFGSIDSFKIKFAENAKSVFGSGWVWLIKTPEGNLQIITTPNQDHPLMDISPAKGIPIIGLDVWEHAYYLKHQNKRMDYIDAFWHIVNWQLATKIYTQN